MRTVRFWIVAATLALADASIPAAQRPGAFGESREHPAIAYGTAPVNTAITALNRRIADGAARLTFDTRSGYLRAVLDALQVPVESQVLVYSQTSFQAPKIARENPRAIFFADTVAVAWVRTGTVVEAWAQDPRQGVVFYTLDQQPSATPQFVRQEKCLACHLSWDTLAVPGPFVLSTFPRKDDNAYADGFVADDRSPIADRWGGWYVTGRRVPARHAGNLPLFMPARPATPPPAPASLQGAFDLSGYPTPYSDVVALMVLEHQAHMTNLITRAGWEARVGDAARVREAVDTMVDYMLFVDEAPIARGGIQGSSGFAELFSATGPRDAKGRSLRELQLDTRMFRYPLSYMIYSPAFEALPAAAKDAAIRRLRQVLTGADTAPRYAHLTPVVRRAILEILAGTRPGLVENAGASVR